MRRSVVALVLLSFGLVACSSERWVHRYKKQEEFVYDYNSCERQALDYMSSGRSVNMSTYVQRTMIDQCLQQQGWVKRPKK